MNKSISFDSKQIVIFVDGVLINFMMLVFITFHFLSAKEIVNLIYGL